MGLNNIVKSRGFRNFMAKLYGWGASIVILGALFKINHYPGAEYMLIVGLGTESIIFFFSAFEPPHVEPDWSLVYPELAGMYHGIAAEESKELNAKGKPSEDLDSMLAEADIGPELIDRLGQGLRSLSENTMKLSDVTDAALATGEFTQNVKSASESVGKLNDSYKKTSEMMEKDLSVSEQYYNSIKDVTASASTLSNAYSQASDSIKKDLGASEEFATSIKTASESAKLMAERYAQSAEALSKSAEALDFTALKENNYSEQLQKISQNLASLNATYELQLQNSKAQSESAGKLQETMERFLESINGSVRNTDDYKEKIEALAKAYEQQVQGTSSQMESVEKLKTVLDHFLAQINQSADKTGRYNEELDELAKKVSALNNVYGNMLSALNVKS